MNKIAPDPTGPTPEDQAAHLARLKTTRRAVTLLGAAAFLVTADARVVSPLLRVIADEFKSDIGTTGLIVTFYTIPYGLFQLVYGPLADRLGKLKVVTFTMALFAVGTALCGLAPDLLALNGLRLLTGVAAAATIPSSLAYIGDNFAYSERQVAIGRFVGLVGLGNLLSTGMGGIVAEFLNWRVIFVVYGIGSLLICGLLWRLSTGGAPDRANPHSPLGLRAFKPFGRLLRRPEVQLVIGTVFIEGFFFYGIFSFFGAFLRDRYHLSYLIVGLILSGFGLGSLIYSRNVGRLVAFFGENGLMIWGGVLMGACLAGMAGLEVWPVFIGLVVLIGLGYFMMHSTLQTRATELSPDARSTAVSLFAFMLFLGQGTGTALLGVIVDAGGGYELIFGLSAAGLALLGRGFVTLETRRRAAGGAK